MKTYVVTAVVDFEVEADSEEDAIVIAEQGMADIVSFSCRASVCYDDEEEE